MSNARNISKLSALASHISNLVGLSNNKASIDAKVAESPQSPHLTGEMKIWPAASAPAGFLLCNGQAISRTTYADLFALIGTTYGAGDGSTTFALPDLRGRVPAGFDSGTVTGRLTQSGSSVDSGVLGASGGTQTHTLTVAQIPAHSHTGVTDTEPDHTHGTTSPAASSNQPGYTVSNSATSSNNKASTAAGSHSHALTIDNTGGGGAHLNVQPTIVLNYIIKT